MNTRHLSDEDRFMTYVEPDTNGGCWLWTGAVAGNGYGAFKHNKRNIGAHRFSLSYFKGAVGSRHVLHSCDTPLCVNPHHLFPGTHADNMADAARKCRRVFRGKSCQRHPASLIDAILLRVAAGESKRSIARDTGVDPASVRYAMNKANQGADQ